MVVETETGTAFPSDSKDAAMAAASGAIDNALDPKKTKAYSAGNENLA